MTVPDQRLDVDRRLLDADQGHAHGNLQAARHQVLARGKSDHAAVLARRIQGLLDGGRVVGLAVRLDAEGGNVNRARRGGCGLAERGQHEAENAKRRRKPSRPREPIHGVVLPEVCGGCCLRWESGYSRLLRGMRQQ